MKNPFGKISKAFQWDLKSTVTLGFVMLLMIMLSMAVIGLNRMAASNTRMERIVDEQNSKLMLVSSMRNIARERVVALFTAITLTDPFERDDALSWFKNLASNFIVMRRKFESLMLTQEEQAQLSKILESVRNASRVQAEIVDLITSDRLPEAQQLLVQRAIPAQNRVIDSYNDFVDLQSKRAQGAIDEGNQANHSAFVLMLALVMAAMAMGLLIAWVVIRRLVQIENTLFEEKELAEVTLHSIADGVITTDKAGMVTYLNPVAERLTGWSAAMAKNIGVASIYNVINEKTRRPVDYHGFLENLDGPIVPLENQVLIRRDGHEFAIKNSAAPIHNKGGGIIGSVVVFNDVSEARNMTRQLSWQACHDPLTGLANRREFERTLSNMLQCAKNQSKHHMLLFLDLDQFKLINDTCGHIAGDEFLRQFSQIVGEKVRESDTFARLGGDEFGLLMGGCSVQRGMTIAEDVRQAVSAFKFTWENKTFEIGVSIGVVPINEQSEDAIDIMRLADAACYKAKNEGRNQIQLFQKPEELSIRRDETNWVINITKALEENRFCLYYQKIVPTVSNGDRRPHYEILLRMKDEQNNVVGPAAFIPAAERYSLMSHIDRWVVRSMLDWLKAHPEQTAANCLYSLNLSGQSLGDDRFLDYVLDQFEQAGVPPATIGFEITETAAIANLGKATHFISRLRELGCQFSLDDFGSGMSSYSYLKNLQVDFLKIDGMFVKNMVDDKVDFAMVESINRIGHVMGIKTVAEFVENDAIYRELDKLGVDYAQGYGIHKPEPLAVAQMCLSEAAVGE